MLICTVISAAIVPSLGTGRCVNCVVAESGADAAVMSLPVRMTGGVSSCLEGSTGVSVLVVGRDHRIPLESGILVIVTHANTGLHVLIQGIVSRVSVSWGTMVCCARITSITASLFLVTTEASV